MRWLFAVAWMCAAMFGASPAFAHSHAGKPHQEAAPVATPPLSVTQTGPCRHFTTFARAALPIVEDHVHHHEDDGAHNPADHTHPAGSDLLHQVFSHHSVDAAFHVDLVPPMRALTSGETIDRRDERHAGITILPPVPPPLG